MDFTVTVNTDPEHTASRQAAVQAAQQAGFAPWPGFATPPPAQTPSVIIEISDGRAEATCSDPATTVLYIDWDNIKDDWSYAESKLDELNDPGLALDPAVADRIRDSIQANWPDEYDRHSHVDGDGCLAFKSDAEIHVDHDAGDLFASAAPIDTLEGDQITVIGPDGTAVRYTVIESTFGRTGDVHVVVTDPLADPVPAGT